MSGDLAIKAKCTRKPYVGFEGAIPLFAKQRTGLGELLHRPRPGTWKQFLAQPSIFLARKLYTWRQTIPAQPLVDPVSVVCVSDTHNSQPPLPAGDVLIHAGDLTQSGSLRELQATLIWLQAQPHPVKIVVAGNHDLPLDASRDGAESKPALERKQIDWGDIIYLENAATTVTCPNGRRLRVYGSPLSARHGNWAFQFPRGEDVWTEMVPWGIDVLVTHGPPRAHLDLLRLGCEHLLATLWRVRPRLHVFGHIHDGTGTEWLQFDELQTAYERTVLSGGGIWNLARTVWGALRTFWRPAAEARCLLVNFAVVGGLRDDERRRPIRVVL
ncbi:Metallo-dependent phosphatase-like protein [Corynascus novoguineensis]|uniref:Metallo-dependent phosphatase-like protein n=1 Tax=Corynascus novoguineensis TaxID=1126955 RepID=A0AAN7CYX3_9PEZI|nr:Metallo-dependent phosphatase-like protein [Corynascus novoguineensis]